jgi:hypothetical protein
MNYGQLSYILETTVLMAAVAVAVWCRWSLVKERRDRTEAVARHGQTIGELLEDAEAAEIPFLGDDDTELNAEARGRAQAMAEMSANFHVLQARHRFAELIGEQWGIGRISARQAATAFAAYAPTTALTESERFTLKLAGIDVLIGIVGNNDSHPLCAALDVMEEGIVEYEEQEAASGSSRAAAARPRYSLAELVAKCDPAAPAPSDLELWDNAKPVGRERPESWG